MRIARISPKTVSNIKLFLIYAIPVLSVLILRFKSEQIHDGSLNASFTVKMFLTAFIADFGLGYYFSRMFYLFFKQAVWICSFIFWFVSFCYLLSFALTNTPPTESIFITVFDTTYHHTLDFLQTVSFSVYSGILLYWGIWFYLAKTVETPSSQKGDFLFYGCLFLVFCIFCFATQWKGSFFNNAYTAKNIYSDLKQEITSLLNNEKTPAFRLESPEIPRTIIIAVGESANRRVFNENISDFKEKTAFLKNQPLIVNDAEATSASTAFTLKKVLLPDDISLISLYRKAGFKTFWFSNHFKSGKDDNLIYALTRNIDDRRYFNYTKTDTAYEYTSQYYDEILLSPFKEALADSAPRKLIFLHLFGSHFPYVHRYPNATEELITDQYAASVRYTNTVLSMILEAAEKSRQSALLLYFSDHGTIPINPFSRASKGADMLNIPMFFWISEEYRKQNDGIIKQLSCLSRPDTSKIAFLINRLAGMDITGLSVPTDMQKCFSMK